MDGNSISEQGQQLDSMDWMELDRDTNNSEDCSTCNAFRGVIITVMLSGLTPGSMNKSTKSLILL
jgi:hypothetical protein